MAVADHWSVQEGAEVCIVMEANITGKLKYNEVVLFVVKGKELRSHNNQSPHIYESINE